MLEIKDATYWAEQLKSRNLSAKELLEMTKQKIDQLNPLYNAIVAEDLAVAKEDLALTGQGFFAGLPFALKMLGQTHKGLPDTASSQLFSENVASEDDNYVKALIRAGLTPYGQTNSPEFGFKNISDSKLYGDTRNVWNSDYYSGGSSGGAASAVASGMFAIAGAAVSDSSLIFRFDRSKDDAWTNATRAGLLSRLARCIYFRGINSIGARYGKIYFGNANFARGSALSGSLVR